MNAPLPLQQQLLYLLPLVRHYVYVPYLPIVELTVHYPIVPQYLLCTLPVKAILLELTLVDDVMVLVEDVAQTLEHIALL